MKLRSVADNLPIQQALAYIQTVGTRTEVHERVGNFRAHQEKCVWSGTNISK
jgi:hypothetical protein